MFKMAPSVRGALLRGKTPWTGDSGPLSTDQAQALALHTFDQLKGRLERLELSELSETEISERVWAVDDRLSDIESRHARPLEELAVMLVRDAFECKPEMLRFEARLGWPEIDVFNAAPPPTEEPEISPDLTAEVKKRRIINGMVQGAAHKLQDLFYLNQAALNEINPELFELYRQHMALGDRMYWTIPDRKWQRIADSSLHSAGMMQLDFSTDPITVRAQAISFPILLHELSKGVMEALALNGLPREDALRREVCRSADRLSYEAWDLRIGPALWEAFQGAVREETASVRNEVFRRMTMLSAERFHQAVEELLSGHSEIVAGITKEVRECRG